VAFIDAHREWFGVEPICKVLSEHGCKIAPNTNYVARQRAASPRAIRDAELVVEIRRVYEENLFVYGADKIWAQLEPGAHQGGPPHGGTANACRGPGRGQTRQGVHRHHDRR
jgi:putative transposase